jgi:hypothetical protein
VTATLNAIVANIGKQTESHIKNFITPSMACEVIRDNGLIPTNMAGEESSERPNCQSTVLIKRRSTLAWSFNLQPITSACLYINT